LRKWAESDIDFRWDDFRKHIKGIGPAMMSEILCKSHLDNFMIWNRRTYAGLNYLQVEDLLCLRMRSCKTDII